MNRKQAQELYLFVNEKANMEALEFYTELRIEYLKDALTKVNTIDDLRKLQGSIEELKRFKTLRDEVLNPKD